jgi:hypothetical protein
MMVVLFDAVFGSAIGPGVFAKGVAKVEFR